MKKYLLFLIIFVAVFNIIIVSPVFAQEEERPLEIDYPDVPNAEAVTPETTTTTFPRYVEYLFYFLIWGAGILALLAIIYGGFKYITAIGNPDKLKDAKDRIISAILGLAIVLGSYVILWEINPRFLIFSLPELKPFINSVSPGVWACKKMSYPTDPIDVWVLEQIYLTERMPQNISPDVASSIARLTSQFAVQGLNLTSISDENNIDIRKAIKKRIDELLVRINEVCYEVRSAGAVKDDFNDKIENIWFIPETIYGTRDGALFVRSVNPYGAAVFDNDDFTGLGNVYIRHMFNVGIGVREPVWILNYPESRTRIKISSIKPFKRYTENNINWKVRLYIKKNFNASFTTTDPFQEILPAIPFLDRYADLSEDGTQLIPKIILDEETGVVISPESMRIDGEALVILYKNAITSRWDGQEQETVYEATPTTIGTGENIQIGYYFKIFFDGDNDLTNDYTIVTWDRCLEYVATEEELEECTISLGGAGQMGGGGFITPKDCCAKAAADAIMVLSNIKGY